MPLLWTKMKRAYRFLLLYSEIKIEERIDPDVAV